MYFVCVGVGGLELSFGLGDGGVDVVVPAKVGLDGEAEVLVTGVPTCRRGWLCSCIVRVLCG